MTDLINCSTAELFALARLNFKNENIEGAFLKLKIVLTRGDAPIDGYALMGRVYRALDMLDEAKNCFQFFLSHRPNTISEQFQLGLCEQDLGNPQGAIEVYDAVLQSNQNYPPALYQRAILFASEGQSSSAMSLLHRLIETADESDPYVPIADRLIVRLEEERDRSKLSN